MPELPKIEIGVKFPGERSIELALEIALEMVKGMTTAQKEQFWTAHFKRMDEMEKFWKDMFDMFFKGNPNV